MYTVYHIQGIKVGYTQNVQQRVINQQGYDSYEVLFETNCIEEASKMEIHFQNMLGYSTDETSYRNIKMIKSTKHTTTFKAEVAKLDLEFMLSIQSIRIGESEIVITQALAEWMMANLNKSQFNSEMFIYNQAFVKASIALAEEVATTKSDATIRVDG